MKKKFILLLALVTFYFGFSQPAHADDPYCMHDVEVDSYFFDSVYDAMDERLSCVEQEGWNGQYWYLCEEIDGWERLNACFTCPCPYKDCYGERKCYYYPAEEPEDPCCKEEEEGGGKGAQCCEPGLPKCPKDDVGDPINVLLGHNKEKETDLQFSTVHEKGFKFYRTYNSGSYTISTLGHSWTHSYNVVLDITPVGDTKLAVIKDETDRWHHYQDPVHLGSGFYHGIMRTKGHLIEDTDGSFVWFRPNGITYTFNSDLKFVSKTDGSGNVQRLTYNADGLLETVTDEASGRNIGFVYNDVGLLEHVTGPVTDAVSDGIWVSYLYDAEGNLTRVTYADDENGSAASGFEYKYEDTNDPHNLTEKLNLAGEFLSSWAYDSLDRAYENITRDGKGVSISYGLTQTVVTNPQGVQKIYTFKTINGLRTITNITGDDGCASCGQDIVRYGYDEKRRVNEVQYSNGRIDRYTDFDASDRYHIEIQASGTPEERTFNYTYHPVTGDRLSIREESILGAGDKSTVFDYDNDGNNIPNENPTHLMHRTIETGFTHNSDGSISPYEYITTCAYDAEDRITEIDGPLPGDQDKVTYTYDAVTGHRLTETHSLGGTTYYTYDAAGNVKTVADPNGVVTTYTYDGRNRVVSTTQNGVTISSTYNAAGEMDTTTDAINRTFDYTYNPEGFLEKIIDPSGNFIYYTYDDFGQRIEEAIYKSDNTRTHYTRTDYGDPANNPDLVSGKPWKTIQRNADDTADLETIYAYDGSGNLKSVTDANGNITRYGYDLFDRLNQVIQPGNVTTTYSYDVHGNLTGVTDAEGNLTLYTYDDMGRLQSTDSPDTGTTTYTYDAAGNIVSKTDAKGITVTYAYDSLNRLTNIVYPDVSENVTYTYDQEDNGKGRLTGVTDPSGNTSYTYDPLGRLLTEAKSISGVTYYTNYTYDAAGNITSIVYPDGRTVSYELGETGQPVGIQTTKDGITQVLAGNLEYLPFGPLQGMTYGYGGIVQKTFDQQYRLTTLSVGQQLQNTYGLDNVGNILSINNQLDDTRDQTFSYDNANRLTGANGIYGAIGFTYDDVGNRLTRTLEPDTDTYGYLPGSNRLYSVEGANSRSYSYDATGNVDAILGANSTILSGQAEFTYNYLEQRVKKTTDGQTTLYHYDQFGNLIGESTPDGKFSMVYVYLGSERLAAIASETTETLAVQVSTDKNRVLAGIKVYAFTESGSYTGKFATTDENGVALFQKVDFEFGNYKFRSDYLSDQFWSDPVFLTTVSETEVVIPEETATVRVTQGGSPEEDITVYLFDEADTYLGLSQVTDGDGEVTFDLPTGGSFRFRADILGGQFFSTTATISPGGENNVAIDSGGGVLTLTVDDGAGISISDVNAYLFSEEGVYLGLTGITDEQGSVLFDAPAGTYQARVDYMGYQFWTSYITMTTDQSESLSIPHQEVTVTVGRELNGDILPGEALKVYLFTDEGSYLNQQLVTDDTGMATFYLPEKTYKIRADYLSQQYWSESFNWLDPSIIIEEGFADISVTNMGLPLADIPVYVFSSSGTYLGLSSISDSDGFVSFRLPAGDYNFRGDYLGSHYWSGETTLLPHVENPVTLSTGGGSFTLTVLKEAVDPLEGVNCYLFSESGTYLGEQKTANSDGNADFTLADGSYKIRVDYLGYQFWTPVFSVPETLSLDYAIAHQDVSITVNRDCNGVIQAGDNLKVYLFTPTGRYLGLNKTTGGEGEAVFNLPEMEYKVRADYLTGQYWSAVFNATDEIITIEEGVAEVQVVQGTTLLENVPVYVFNESDTYLNLNGQSDADGIVSFELPGSTYKFRADHQGSQYWATEPVTAHQVSIINIDTGGGSFSLSLEKAPGYPMAGVPVYVFTSGGAYLGVNQQTDGSGAVSFDLAEGSYKFRADYLGYRFWTGVIDIPTTFSEVLTIAHQDVVIDVASSYQSSPLPIGGIPVYLFTAAGAYQGKNASTDGQGRVVFSLPAQSYKIRADYMGYQFWSDAFVQTDTSVSIDHGRAMLHVTTGGLDVVDAPVYLFKASGSYLRKVERTDGTGMAAFDLPIQAYKFRVDYAGAQYWSDTITLIPNEENSIELNLDLLALDLTNNPNPDRFDGEPPEYRPKGTMVASIGSLYGLLSQTVVGQIPREPVYYYINDHLGTPQKMVDENGTVVWAADYMPFGKASVTVNTIENNFRFAGQYYDQETGLHYNYHRYYDPTLGRYLRADPIGLEGGINLYLYAESNPVIAVDPFGLKECSYYGWWGKHSFKVNSLDIDVKFGSGLPNKWLKFHIGTAIFNINGTIKTEINCLKVCDECDGQKWKFWRLNPSYTDTVSPEFKIRKGPIPLFWRMVFKEVDYSEVKEKYCDKAMSVLKSELTKRAISKFGDATTYCKASGAKK